MFCIALKFHRHVKKLNMALVAVTATLVCKVAAAVMREAFVGEREPQDVQCLQCLSRALARVMAVLQRREELISKYRYSH